jgi:hypothetical protein
MLTVRLKRLASRLRYSKAPSAMLRSWSPFHLGPSNTQSQDGAHVNIPVIIASFDLPPIRLYFCRGLSTLRYDTTAAVNESFETLISIMIHLSCIVCPIHCPAMPLYEEAPCKPVREITSLRQFPLEHALMQEVIFCLILEDSALHVYLHWPPRSRIQNRWQTSSLVACWSVIVVNGMCPYALSPYEDRNHATEPISTIPALVGVVGVVLLADCLWQRAPSTWAPTSMWAMYSLFDCIHGPQTLVSPARHTGVREHGYLC